jgi:hypothetical protein
MNDDHDPAEQHQAVPPSFIALYVPPGRIKPTEPRNVIQARYEFCEDLAQALTDTAQQQRMALDIETADVLQRVAQGLSDSSIGLVEAEAQWVLTRLAELLNWPPLPQAQQAPNALS